VPRNLAPRANLPLTERRAELPFRALRARHEQGSVIVNSDLAFSGSTQVFKTEGIAVAMRCIYPVLFVTDLLRRPR